MSKSLIHLKRFDSILDSMSHAGHFHPSSRSPRNESKLKFTISDEKKKDL